MKLLRQLLLGNYADETTLLGTAGQIALGFTGIDAAADIRDLSHDILNWEWSREYTLKTLLDGVGLFPVVGTLKNIDEAADLVKHSDDVVEGAEKFPQGFTEIEFKKFASDVTEFSKNNNIPNGQILVHGSRVSGTATPTSDIDIIVRVNQKTFDLFVEKRLSSIPKDTRLYKTIIKAAGKQKLSIFDIGRDFGKNLYNDLIPKSPIKDIDFSIIIEGSLFDTGPFIPLN